MVGETEGETDGLTLGITDGETLGITVGETLGETVGIVVGEVVGDAVGFDFGPPATQENVPDSTTVIPFRTEIAVFSAMVAPAESSRSCPFRFRRLRVPTFVSATYTSRLVVVAPKFTPRTLTISRLLPCSRYRAVPVGVDPPTAGPVNSAASGPFGQSISAPAADIPVNGMAIHAITRERQIATEPKLLSRLFIILKPPYSIGILTCMSQG
jgi:hypothetical protein